MAEIRLKFVLSEIFVQNLISDKKMLPQLWQAYTKEDEKEVQQKRR